VPRVAIIRGCPGKAILTWEDKSLQMSIVYAAVLAGRWKIWKADKAGQLGF